MLGSTGSSGWILNLASFERLKTLVIEYNSNEWDLPLIRPCANITELGLLLHPLIGRCIGDIFKQSFGSTLAIANGHCTLFCQSWADHLDLVLNIHKLSVFCLHKTASLGPELFHEPVQRPQLLHCLCQRGHLPQVLRAKLPQNTSQHLINWNIKHKMNKSNWFQEQNCSKRSHTRNSFISASFIPHTKVMLTGLTETNYIQL